MTKLIAEMHCVMSQIRKAKCTFYATHHGTVLCKVLCYQISVRLSIAACNNHHSFKMGSLTCAQKDRARQTFSRSLRGYAWVFYVFLCKYHSMTYKILKRCKRKNSKYFRAFIWNRKVDYCSSGWQSLAWVVTVSLIVTTTSARALAPKRESESRLKRDCHNKG